MVREEQVTLVLMQRMKREMAGKHSVGWTLKWQERICTPAPCTIQDLSRVPAFEYKKNPVGCFFMNFSNRS